MFFADKMGTLVDCGEDKAVLTPPFGPFNFHACFNTARNFLCRIHKATLNIKGFSPDSILIIISVYQANVSSLTGACVCVCSAHCALFL